MKTSKLIQTRSLHFPENGIYIRGDKELQERINLLIGYFRKNYFDKKYKKVADIVDKNIIFNASKKRGCLSGILIQKFLLNPNGEEFEEYFPNIRNFFDMIYNAIPKELFEYRGCLITIEGGDCVGKTTIMSKLDLGDRPCILTREPGGKGSQIAENIREIILDNAFKYKMDYLTEFMLYSTSRAQHVREIIEPAIESGVTVISDRLYFSSIVYQGLLRGIDYKTIIDITKIAMGDVKIDLVLSLYSSNKTMLDRLSAKVNKDRLEGEKVDFYTTVNEIFKSISVYDNDNLYINNCISGIDPYVEIMNINTEEMSAEEFNKVIVDFIEDKYNI